MNYPYDTTAETTRIERVPACRPRTSEFDVYVDGRVIATCSTRAEAQEVLDDYRYERLRRTASPVQTGRVLAGDDLVALWHTDKAALVQHLASLTPTQLGAQALINAQWLRREKGKTIDPVEVVGRYQRLIATGMQAAA